MYQYYSIKQIPDYLEVACEWFSEKWNVSKQEYFNCMTKYLNDENELAWFLCLDNKKIIAGVGIIENDFHVRKDLSPNICALYVEKQYRNHGIAKELLNMAIDYLRQNGFEYVYLVSDHIGFYEKYGWKFECMVKESYSDNMTRLYSYKCL